MTEANDLNHNPLKSYLVKSIVLVGALALAGANLAAFDLWQVILAMLPFIVLTTIAGLYHLIIKKTRRNLIFTKGGWLSWTMNLRWLMFLITFLVTSTAIFFMFLQMPVWGWVEWSFLALAIPVFFWVHSFTSRHISKQIKYDWLGASYSLSLSCWITPIILTVCYLAFSVIFLHTPAYDDLGSAIAAQSTVLEQSSSALISAAASWANAFHGLKAYALGRLGSFFPLLSLLPAAVGYFVVFCNLSLMLSFTQIPRSEMKRLLLPLNDVTDLPPIPTVTIVMTGALAALGLWVVYLHGFLWLEQMAMHPDATGNKPWVISLRDDAVEVADTLVYSIDGVLYRADIEKFRNEAEALIRSDWGKASAEIRQTVNRQFDKRLANVDAYLDWYYSLTGEYSRLVNLAMGQMEEYMIKMCIEYLDAGIDSSELDKINQLYLGKVAQHQKALRAKLEKYRLPDNSGPVKIVATVTMADFISPMKPSVEFIGFQNRAKAAAAGGVVGGVGGVIAYKLAQKTIFKAAAKAVLKMAASKGISILGTTAIGAAAGSVAPGPGNIIGAGIGLVVGLGTAVVADIGLMSLEEAVDRGKFKAEIEETINEQRREWLAMLPAE